MKNKLITILCLAAMSAQAQVKFKIQLLADQKTYQVSMVPQATWSAPDNLTSTAQITILADAEAFEPTNVQNLVNGAEFEYNSRTFAPAENSQSDYFSFGLKTLGTSRLNYLANVETPLFTFENAKTCTGGMLRLIDHATDPLFKNPNKKANVGNYLSVVGAGGDAFSGNFGSGDAPCAATSSTGGLNFQNAFSTSPNPFIEQFFLKIHWQNKPLEKAKIQVTDALGRVVFEQQKSISMGIEQVSIDLKNTPPGVYQISVVNEETLFYSEKLVKISL